MTGLSRNTPISGGGPDSFAGGPDSEGVSDEPPPPQAVNNTKALVRISLLDLI